RCRGTAIMAARTFSLLIPCSRKRWIITPRERSDFKPIFTIAESSRVEGTSGTLGGGVTMRALLLAAVIPPPSLERPNRFVVPEAKEDFTGLRIMGRPMSEWQATAHSQSNQNAGV